MLLGPTVGPLGRRLETSRIHTVSLEDPVATNRRVPAKMAQVLRSGMVFLQGFLMRSPYKPHKRASGCRG